MVGVGAETVLEVLETVVEKGAQPSNLLKSTEKDKTGLASTFTVFEMLSEPQRLPESMVMV